MKEAGRLSIGIIGAGGIANSVHLPGLIRMEGIEISAVCDAVEEKAAKTAEKFSIPKIYTSYREMLAKEALDAVYVLVQPDQIFRIALDCMNAGLDVFIEKPAGITTFQAESLLRKSQETGKILQVGLNRRYIPLVRHVLDMMKETTGITQVEGCFFKNGTAAFYDGCASAFVCDTIHAIDLVRWIAGGEPVKAATLQSQENSEVPNAWNSIIRFDNGITGIIKANYQTGGRVHTFEIHGPRASAYINLGFGDAACEAKIIFFEGKSSHSISAAGASTQKIVHIDGKSLAGSGEYYRYYGYYQEALEFIECLGSRKQPLANIAEAVKTMRLVDMLGNSLI